jgi:hypothetical protein
MIKKATRFWYTRSTVDLILDCDFSLFSQHTDAKKIAGITTTVVPVQRIQKDYGESVYFVLSLAGAQVVDWNENYVIKNNIFIFVWLNYFFFFHCKANSIRVATVSIVW